MKLLVITSGGMFPYRGAVRLPGIFFANLLRRLLGLCGTVVVVTPRPYIPRFLTRFGPFRRHAPYRSIDAWEGLPIYRPVYPRVGGLRRQWPLAQAYVWAALPLCLRLHRRHRFDLVIANGFGPSAHAAEVIAYHAGLRSLIWGVGSDIHAHPWLSPDNKRLFRHNVRHADAILTTSRALERIVRQTCPPADHAHTFYRGIDLEPLKVPGDRLALRRGLGLDPERVYMLMAGNVLEAKGVAEFLEALRALAALRPEVSAIWVGDGPEAAWARRRAEHDGLADRFTLTGFVPRARVLEYLQAADVMAFPSRAEGLPNVVMEAMAAGLPVVATDVGGVAEIVADGVTGILVPPRDAGALTAGLCRILDDPARSRTMARRGREMILRHFDVERNAPVLLDVLEAVASGEVAESGIPPCAGVPPGHLPIDLAAEEATREA